MRVSPYDAFVNTRETHPLAACLNCARPTNKFESDIV